MPSDSGVSGADAPLGGGVMRPAASVTTRRPGPAILVGEEARVVVAVARSLHGQGMPTIVAVPAGASSGIRSRAIDDVIELDGPLERRAAGLVAVAELHRASWVAPCSDAGLRIVREGYRTLAALVPLAAPPPPVIDRVLDRTVTLDVAASCGVPVPNSVGLGTDTALAALNDQDFPLLARPVHRGEAPGRAAEMRIIRSQDELRAAFDADPDFGRALLFQTLPPGTGAGVGILMHHGEPVATFQHRRLREYPAPGGAAVAVRSEAVDPVLLDHAVRLLRALGWDGVAMVEFRHDPATGRAALMDVNGRFWGSLALAVRAGVEFPWLAYQTAHGVPPVSAPPYEAGITMRWTAGSLLRLRDGVVRGAQEPGRAGRLRAAAQFVADFAPGVHSALWSGADPGPALQETAGVLRGWAREAAGTVARAVLPAGTVPVLREARFLEGGRRRAYLARQAARAAGLLAPQPLPAPIRQVLFVCHGNIMRSAAAAELLRAELARRGVDGVAVTSCGVYAHPGQAADPRMRDAVRAAGVSLDRHAAQPISDELVDAADVIFAMDELNFIDIAARFPRARPKTRLLRGLRPGAPYVGQEIRDPYTGTDRDVAATVALLSAEAAALAEHLGRAAVEELDAAPAAASR